MMPSNNEISVVPIFATPFASMDTGADAGFNNRLARLCEVHQAESGHRARPTQDPLIYHSDADFLERPDAEISELKRIVLGNAFRTIESLNTFSASDLQDLRLDANAWCSIVQRNGHVPSQHFRGAAWVGVYCVQAGEPDKCARNAGVLRIHETRLSSIYRDASNWEARTPYRYGHFSWTPKPGWMALFPAHIQHEISVVRSSTPLILVFAVIRCVNTSIGDRRYG